MPLNPSFQTRQVTSALGHLEASYLIISLESNLPRKPPMSNLPLLEKLVNSSHTKPFRKVQSLKKVITVDNSCGRVNAPGFPNFVTFRDILEDGSYSGVDAITETNLSPDDIVNIQFTSGYVSTYSLLELFRRY